MSRPAPIEVPPIDVTDEECDRALARYLRAWEQVEASQFLLFKKLLDTPIQVALIVHETTSNFRDIRDMMEALGRLRLDKQQSKELNAVLASLKSATTKRNRIIHGKWQLEIRLPPKGRPAKEGKATWVRFYTPSDPALFTKVFGTPYEQKTRNEHRFTLKDLDRFSEEAKYLSARIRRLTDDLVLLPVTDPTPLKFGE